MEKRTVIVIIAILMGIQTLRADDAPSYSTGLPVFTVPIAAAQ